MCTCLHVDVLAGLPSTFFEVGYRAEMVPGHEPHLGLAGGSNCQRFAYAVLAQSGRDLPSFWSDELWRDDVYTYVVADAKPLDLVLYAPSSDPYAAHVGIVVGKTSVLHLCEEIGRPVVWDFADFAARQRYRTRIGFKRVRTLDPALVSIGVAGESFVVLRGTENDVAAVMALRVAAARWLVSLGIDQWSPDDPFEPLVRGFTQQHALWVVRQGDRLAGSVAVLWTDPTVWGAQADEAGYVHSLVIDRAFAGRGLGDAILEWAESHISRNGRSLARLDCVRGNRKLRDYYEAGGYRHVGDRDFPDAAWARGVALYEKALCEANRS